MSIIFNNKIEIHFLVMVINISVTFFSFFKFN
ncbi:hypothetical protein HDEF_0735 [Candidatus Hamiltonella defensa 5AT (Acyrthosiphon pisum)]|uniref:Uncharacterized protein n=1 Tax=Hamiltonella defensa subsp. Acyrthosiphon pisum (strain 5AT) TaxID=572265 RepID=C4K4H3_HAMD5|nr:hypothetical protein HDEF_0735 [Candidatus Hamiltonella defensa 5AT (Acyrthosiphon pisum)]